MKNTNNLWDGRDIEYWVRMLEDLDGEARWSAIDALRHIAHPSQSVPLFIGALNDRYWRVRALAAHSLYDMAHEENMIPFLLQAVIPLAGALGDESPDVGLNACYALEVLGPVAGASLPQLREAAGLDDDRRRKAASEAVHVISG